MVRINEQIALRFDLQVEQPMARHLIEHVIKKMDAGGKGAAAAAVQTE